MEDAIGMLTADHKKFLAMLGQLEDQTGGKDERHSLLAEIEKEVKIHSMLEEELVYPAFKEHGKGEESNDMYFESLEEHHVVDMILPELKAMLDKESERFKAKATVVRELIRHHADEEEREMFPMMRSTMNDAALRELGIRMHERRNVLEKEWENPVSGAMRKLQSAADKFMPSSIKEARGSKKRAEDRDRDEDRPRH